MANPRLYYGPEVTESVLRHVIKGANTREELAERLNCSEKTVYNKVHDPKILGFLARQDSEYVITDKDELMGLFQLDERGVLKERFLHLPGVSEVNDQLNGGDLSFIRVGRLIAYYTDSEAIDEEAFETYGRTYANWFKYFGLGYPANGTLFRNKPEDYEKRKSGSRKRSEGLGYPRVRPEKVFEALSIIENGISGRAEIASHFDFSERQAAKLLSTCYILGFADRDGKVSLTERGQQVLEVTGDERKKMVREALLDLKLIETYLDLAPDGRFKNQELMEAVGKELNRNWAETTVQTKAKRIYQWLVYSGLFHEVKRGTLIRSTQADQDSSGPLSDYV